MKHAIFGMLAAVSLALPAWADPVSIRTARGLVSFDSLPERVAVYDMAALDTLDALGVPVAGSVEKTFVPQLRSYQGDLGTLFEPNFEALYALAPDLVIAGGRSAPQVDALARIAPTIDMTFTGDLLIDEALERLADYGKLFGREDRAAQIAEGLNAKVAAARAAISGKGNGLIILTNGPKISAYGAGSRFGWIHGELGLPEAVENVHGATHGEAVSFEFIRQADPDWLLVLDRAAAIGAEAVGAQATLDNPLVRETKAWKAGHVLYLNAAEIYISSGGVQSLSDTLDLLIDAFGGA
ncbi:siderophore ABC transporter substrate-binding protein [Pseudodonghicola flavimaris]|uniref:Siderophore ABC transporter substrate-binding protein n=1 Tax=Pseudodonghicola flavimaris TaxID=3050036 RepID=A0ABT7F5E2_9RHOB|nr:siderophore ABC transporter substrate-binding protein [Pseudodonghicola flavimaris]MDK3019815.1 siderophore ABC transporter substrate-binding protein [Pseudodonghicola flavimaris]